MLTGQMDATAQAPARPSRGALPAQLRGKPELEEAMGRREPGDSGGCGARGTQPLPGRRPVSLTAHEVLGHPSRPWNTQGRGACDSEAQRRPLMAARSPERPERNCRAEPRCAFRVSGGRKAGEDRRAAVPTAAVKAMAVGVRMLRLCRVVPGCGAGWRWIATAAAQLTPPELTEMRNDLFNKEKKRQLSLTPRTEKIEVKHVGKTDPGAVFVMNKNVSTPYSCAMLIAGAFCYDVVLDKKLDEWMPTKENLRSFTKDVHALIYKDLPFETLEVEAKVALEIFQHNKYKIDFIEEKASQNPERIVKLHRIGDFIDVSEGPLIPRTGICFQYEVSAVHNLHPTQPSLVRRFQGLSLPVHLRAHFTIWDKLLERSRKLVTANQSKRTEENVTTQ
uniref:Large ribosomal subunit protein mL39 n=1 Tax=Oryctolagus cuniculus TaxID=9986 RepID=A0A5F9DU64_RABIT